MKKILITGKNESAFHNSSKKTRKIVIKQETLDINSNKKKGITGRNNNFFQQNYQIIFQKQKYFY